MKSKISRYMRRRIYELRTENKMTFKDIAAKLGMLLPNVSFAFYRYEKELKQKELRGTPEARDEKLKALHESGVPVRTIAAQVGVSRELVYQRLAAMDLIKRRSYPLKGQPSLRHLNPEQARRRDERARIIVAMYTSEGKTVGDISQFFKISESRVRDILRAQNVTLKTRRPDLQGKYDDIVRMYVNEGKSLYQIAKDLNTNHETIRQMLKSKNVPMKPRGRQCNK